MTHTIPKGHIPVRNYLFITDNMQTRLIFSNAKAAHTYVKDQFLGFEDDFVPYATMIHRLHKHKSFSFMLQGQMCHMMEVLVHGKSRLSRKRKKS